MIEYTSHLPRTGPAMLLISKREARCKEYLIFDDRFPASLWRQMILILHRAFARHSTDVTFLLALATEQYGIYLAVCTRLEEASRVDSEAVAIASNADHGGDYAGCGLSYWLFRQRTLFKRNKHVEVGSDASQLISHCRRLRSIDPKRHRDTLEKSEF